MSTCDNSCVDCEHWYRYSPKANRRPECHKFPQAVEKSETDFCSFWEPTTHPDAGRERII